VDEDGVISWTVGKMDNYMSSSTYGATAYVRVSVYRPSIDTDVIATVNEEIAYTEGEGGVGYDHVEVDADFSNAKGNLISYHGGHIHGDTDSKTCYQGGSLSFPIITTRCDAKEENEAILKAERVAGTITE
jgi:hypothetical protein